MSSMKLDFTNKIVLITGSSSGIGAACAELLSSYGAQLVITGRNDKCLSDVKEKCTHNSPSKLTPLAVKADLLLEKDVQLLAEKTLHTFGGVDILVNNAGFGTFYSFDSDKFMEGYDKVMQLNVRSVIQLTHILLPSLKQRKGSIINVSSICSLQPTSALLAYSMSKAAMDSFTQSLAQLAGPEVRVNSLNPGPIDTKFYNNLLEGPKDRPTSDAFDTMPLKRAGSSEEMANIVAFLASNAASYMTGSIIVADGGFLVKKTW